MMQVRYIASRGINTVASPVHVQGTEYTMTVVLASMEYDRDTVAFDAVSLNGNKQTTYYRTDVKTSVRTVPVAAADLPNFREFLASTEAGERFEFDDGNGFVDVVMDSPYTETRSARYGDGGGNDRFTFSWTHREI